jgi:hypothetical protein
VTRWHLALCAAAFAAPVPGTAQSYRLRIDARAQTVAFRGVTLDSIPVADTVTGAGGGPATPEGFAAHCPRGAAYCTYFRPGPVRRGGPLVTTADLAAWGFGIRGLSVHGTARAGVDMGSADVWPGTDPALQLLAGYLEYATERVTARAGRQTMLSRLGATGVDGGAVTVRDARRGLQATAFAGWGLARGVALPVTSPALNPLDDFQPRRRQLVAGLAAEWSGARADARIDYQREVDPRSDYFVSERLAVAGSVRPAAGWSVEGGAEYDLAAAWWGTTDLRLGYATRSLAASLGARRYRPHFDLWTIWGAFSPVPYSAIRGHAVVRIHARAQLRARGEWFRFDDADVATPLVRAERSGWRGEIGATALPGAAWTLDAGYHREYAPGSASVGGSAALTYHPSGPYRFTLHGSTLDRPLEFRYNEAVLHVIGLDADAEVNARLRVGMSAARYVENRHRPDAASIDWSQWRLALRAAAVFGRGDELGGLPPAVRRLPGDKARR